MKTLHLDVDLLARDHPDYPLIWDWLTKVGVDPAWVKLPSQVRILKDAVIVSEYVHKKDTGELVYVDDVPLVSAMRYEGHPPHLPHLLKARLTDD